MKEVISVVLGVYNEPVFFIKQSIDSILKQTYKHLEFIIINDNPVDVDIDNFIKSYSDSRIKYHRNIENLGLAKSLNVGIKLAKGEFIARMDADDISFIDRLEKQLLFLKNNSQIDVVGSAAIIIDEIGNKKGLFKCPVTSEQIKVIALFGMPFIHPTIVFRKKVFTEYDFYYNEDYTTAQDFELWSRLVHRLNVANLAEPLLYYRQSKQQLSASRVTEQTAFYMSAVVAQLNKLGVIVTEDQKVLLNLMSRNKKNESLSIFQIIAIRKVLEQIFNTIPKYSNYNRKLLAKHLFINFVMTLFNYNGSIILFNKEVLGFLKKIKINIYNKVLFCGFAVKINLLTLKNKI